jgi:hypothetical protein
VAFARGAAEDHVESKDGVYSQDATFATKVTCMLRANLVRAEDLFGRGCARVASEAVKKTRRMRAGRLSVKIRCGLRHGRRRVPRVNPGLLSSHGPLGQRLTIATSRLQEMAHSCLCALESESNAKYSEILTFVFQNSASQPRFGH